MSKDQDDRMPMDKLDERLRDLLTQIEHEPVPETIRDLAEHLKSALDEHTKQPEEESSSTVAKQDL